MKFLSFFCFSFHPTRFISGEDLTLTHGRTYQSFQKLLKDLLSTKTPLIWGVFNSVGKSQEKESIVCAGTQQCAESISQVLVAI